MAIVCVFLFIFSCQYRISAVANIAIDLISYLINLCASVGWHSAHMIYCAKFIRLNQRALVEYIKSLGIVAVKHGNIIKHVHIWHDNFRSIQFKWNEIIYFRFS